MTTVIWWIRRDLRLFDNQALTTALANADHVIPVFIVDPALWHSRYSSAKRKAFLIDALQSLDKSLRTRGSQLVVRQDTPVEGLAYLGSQYRADHIYAEADYSPFARKRDKAVAEKLPLTLTGGATLLPPDAVRKANGTPYTVFTPYSRAWKTLSLPDMGSLLMAPDHIPTPGHIHGQPLPESSAGYPRDMFPANEECARRALNNFAQTRIHTYAQQRDILDAPGTSALSPYFRFGLLSIREAAALANLAGKQSANPAGVSTWLNELIWREFYISILYHFPYVRTMSFREALRDVEWDNDPEHFLAWQRGQTGYPVVDAAMRQLLNTGWMHNRARMIVASFLTKDLLIDWRWGEQHFMQQLLDGDPAANNGGWQWSAGTGTDAAPYFRIFNPVIQGQKYDPEGDYIRHWIPELRTVPSKYIHEPWALPAELQQSLGVHIGKDYPAPIVDHPWARQRTLEAYKAAQTRDQEAK